MLEEIKEKWDDILLNIKEEHDISEVSYRTWLLPLIPDSVDKDILTILVPDSAFISYVKKKYEFLLKITIEEITGFQCELDFKLKSDVKEPEKYYAGFDIIEMTDTLVRCEHRKLCENLVRYLRKQVDLDEKSENQ